MIENCCLRSHHRMWGILIKVRNRKNERWPTAMTNGLPQSAGGSRDDIIRIRCRRRGVRRDRTERNGFGSVLIDTLAPEGGFHSGLRRRHCRRSDRHRFSQQGSEIESGRDVELRNGCQRRELAGRALRGEMMTARIRSVLLLLEAHHHQASRRMRSHWAETQWIGQRIRRLLLT